MALLDHDHRSITTSTLHNPSLAVHNGSSQPLVGQIVHARKCYKRLFFIDLRVNNQLKCTVLFRSDDTRELIPHRLSDQELVSRWKRVKRGDTVELHVFEASEAEVSKRDHPVYQATDFTVLSAWPGNDPFPSEPAMGLKEAIDMPTPPRNTASASVSASASASAPSISPGSTALAEQLVIDTAVSSMADAGGAAGDWEAYCKFWINSQKCLKQDCRKKHPTGAEYTRVQEVWVRERTQARKKRSKLEDDPHTSSSKVPHSQRAFIFCRWLVDIFGKDYLNSGSGVLDVAGGKGEISLFLTHMFGIRSTVVEPNVRRDKPYQRRNLMSVIQKHVDIDAGGDGLYYKRPPAPLLSSSVNSSSSDKGVIGGVNASEDEEDAEDPEAVKKERRRIKKLQLAQFVVPRLCTLLDDKFAEDHGSVLEGASILIGMHPDQATEPIVDMALKHSKPFAVVPCCVFAHENTHRRLSNGGEVNTTLEFIDYLMEKGPRGGASVSREFLPFDGMNIVVYRRPAQ